MIVCQVNGYQKDGVRCFRLLNALVRLKRMQTCITDDTELKRHAAINYFFNHELELYVMLLKFFLERLHL